MKEGGDLIKNLAIRLTSRPPVTCLPRNEGFCTEGVLSLTQSTSLSRV